MELLNVGLTGSEVITALRKAFEPYIGSIWAGGNATETAVAETATFYPITVNPDSVGENILRGFTRSGSTLTCTADGWYQILVGCCFTAPQNNSHIRIRIGVDGVSLPSTCSGVTAVGTGGSGRRESACTHTEIQLTAGQTVEIMAGNFTDDANIVVSNFQISVKEF